jgi:hypothetical protein
MEREDEPTEKTASGADVRHISELLDGISGSLERIRFGLREAVEHDTIPLNEL